MSLRGSAEFYRAHGLGNDYLVFEAVTPLLPGWPVNAFAIRAVCDRRRGVGSDGIVILLDRDPEDDIFPLRMFNPDGSEFERSGNGLRVLATYLHGEGLVGTAPFEVRSGGSVIPMTVHGHPPDRPFDVSLDMGKARVGAAAVRLDSAKLDSEGRVLHPSRGAVRFLPVTVGNPHAVVFMDDGAAQGGSPGAPGSLHADAPLADALADLGPFLATHPAFREGTNVQLVDEVSPGRMRIRIWERGVGRTSASGTSSCAAAVAAVATGRLKPGDVSVEMDGGTLLVRVGEGLEVTLRGPVEGVARGRLTPEFLEGLEGR